MHKVQRPAGIRPCLNKDRRSCSNSAPSGSSLAHAETLLSVEPVDAVDPRGLTALAQENEQPTITKASPFIGEVT
jgi:hypothetical protein